MSHKIASEASYVHFMSGQKLIKNAKMVNLASFWKLEAFGQTVLPDMLLFIEQKLVKNAKLEISYATFWVIFKHCVQWDVTEKCRILEFDL